MPELLFQADMLRRRMGDDEERRRSHVVSAIPHLRRPAVGTIDGIEQPSTHHDSTTGCGRTFENLGVDRIPLEHPRMEFRSISEPVFDIGTRAL